MPVVRSAFLVVALLAVAVSRARAGGWVPPTPEELHMTSIAEAPGANAVYLSYDETDDDQKNDHNITVRLKVLTQAGVARYADVQIGVPERNYAVEGVEARTVHPDGQVIPFTGKPFTKTVRRHGEQYRATVFSMPDVQVGSILEYHYRLAYSDKLLLPAHWYVQQDAYVLHAHYVFKPFDTSGSHYVIIDHGQTSRGLYYVSLLPKDAKVVPSNGVGHPFYELTVSHEPALPDEDALPPIDSFSDRMLFYYTAQLDTKSYWADEGRFLSKDMNRFAAPGPKMKADLGGLVSAADAEEVKTRKLYAAAMKMENTDFTREHTRNEDQAQGLRAVKTAEDIWVRQRGSSEEIALTYLALVRAAGLRAYGMQVTDRNHNMFDQSFFDTSQLNATIVIVSVNGKDVFLDPGSRFCPYGQLAWQHSWAGGVRQTDGGTQIAASGGLNYKDSVVRRTAMLALSEAGDASGTVTLEYSGQEAMELRQRETGEAAADTKQRFEEQLRRMVPGGMKLHVILIENLEDGEKPLRIVYGVSGPVGTVSGHRLLVAESLLRQDETERFTSPTRKNAVYFHYPYATSDIVELQLPKGLKLEAVPQTQQALALDSFAYTLQASSSGDTLRLTRTVAVNGLLSQVSDYPKLREFFGNLRAADENQLLFVRSAAAASGDAAQGSEAANGPGK